MRRLFASSPRDPRYHMLEHLSSKFRSQPQIREPRAALILNRFSRELPVMFSTNAVSSILGISSDDLTGKSFYECIQENCLPEAIRCLESAKANDSIAYLRFRYRDPRHPEDHEDRMSEGQDHSSDSEDGGVELGNQSAQQSALGDISTNASASPPSASQASSGVNVVASTSNSRTSSGNTTDVDHDSTDAIFDRSQATRSSTSSVVASSDVRRRNRAGVRNEAVNQAQPDPIEIEAVVSCTSDGLVVILRRARPHVPSAMLPQQPANGFFAAPWGVNPVYPHAYAEPQYGLQHGLGAPAQPNVAVGGPDMIDFMQSIREVAVFAWSLTGINGNIASYSRGNPVGEATPPEGFPVWDPRVQTIFEPPRNQAQSKWEQWERTNMPYDGNGSTRYPHQHPRQGYLLDQNMHHGQYSGSMNTSEMSQAAAFHGGPGPAQLNAQHAWNLQRGQQPGQQSVQQSGQQFGQQLGIRPGQHPGQQFGQQPGIQPGQQPGQQNQWPGSNYQWSGNNQHNGQNSGQWPPQNNNQNNGNYDEHYRRNK